MRQEAGPGAGGGLGRLLLVAIAVQHRICPAPWSPSAVRPPGSGNPARRRFRACRRWQPSQPIGYDPALATGWGIDAAGGT